MLLKMANSAFVLADFALFFLPKLCSGFALSATFIMCLEKKKKLLFMMDRQWNLLKILQAENLDKASFGQA